MTRALAKSTRGLGRLRLRRGFEVRRGKRRRYGIMRDDMRELIRERKRIDTLSARPSAPSPEMFRFG
jgi:hypothetical protein